MFSLLLWASLFTPITDDDLARQPDAIQNRMAFLKPGMKEAEVKLILGIGQRQPTSALSLNRYHSYSVGQFNNVYDYQWGGLQTLEIVIQNEDGKLVSVTLCGEGPRVLATFRAIKWPARDDRPPMKWEVPTERTTGDK